MLTLTAAILVRMAVQDGGGPRARVLTSVLGNIVRMMNALIRKQKYGAVAAADVIRAGSKLVFKRKDLLKPYK